MPGVSGKIGPVLSIKETRAGDYESGEANVIAPSDWAWTIFEGTGAGQADRQFSDRRSLSGAASENIDLAGVLTGVFGILTMVKVKGFIVRAVPTNANPIRVIMPATNGVVGIFIAAGDGLDVYPGGCFMWYAPNNPLTVTPATGDLLLGITATTTAADYDIVVLGTSA